MGFSPRLQLESPGPWPSPTPQGRRLGVALRVCRPEPPAARREVPPGGWVSPPGRAPLPRRTWPRQRGNGPAPHPAPLQARLPGVALPSPERCLPVAAACRVGAPVASRAAQAGAAVPAAATVQKPRHLHGVGLTLAVVETCSPERLLFRRDSSSA